MSELFQTASSQLIDSVLQNMVSIAEEYKNAGADISRILSSRGSRPSVTVVGFTDEAGQPIIEVDFTNSVVEAKVNYAGGSTVESIRRPGSITELLDIFRSHMAFYYGSFDVSLSQLKFKPVTGGINHA